MSNFLISNNLLYFWPGNSYWRRRICTVDLLVLTSLNQLFVILKISFTFFYKTSYLNMEANGTEPCSPLNSVPWFGPICHWKYQLHWFWNSNKVSKVHLPPTWDPMPVTKIFGWRHNTQPNDTQHNGIQHNYTQHYGLICDTQHNSSVTMLSVAMLSVPFYL